MSAPRIKFCGITRPGDAELAVSLGAWAVGVILWPGSPRAVSLERAAELAALVKRRAEAVGVFVNPTLEQVERAVDVADLTVIQLHGQEGPAFCGELARRTGCKVIKAVRVRGGADIQALGPFHTDFHLVDSYKPGVVGGSGEVFAWDLAREHRRLAPPRGKGQRVPLILSGGLTPDNVAEAIAAVSPWAVDTASGVESAPGFKDAALMRAFAAAVASTAQPPSENGADEPAPPLAESRADASASQPRADGTDLAGWAA